MDKVMDVRETRERMQTGRLYYESGSDLGEEQVGWLELLYDYNSTRPSEGKRREALLERMFAEIGENCYFEPPLHANWAGKYVHLGSRVYANFNLTLVDDTDIYIGSDVMFGPNVVVCTGTHPICPEIRRKHAQYNLPVRIGNNVWVGAGAVILPGVTIGDNSVIGAGSVVTKDIPANVVAVGNPCRVLREIDDNDRKYFRPGMEIDLD